MRPVQIIAALALSVGACGDNTASRAERCVPGRVQCGDICVDPKTDALFCGAGPDCSANAGAICAPGERCNGSGVCALSCQAGLVDCNGTCIDPDTDETYCGAGPDCSANAGTTCAPGERCDGTGVCALSCESGRVDCNGTCIDPDTDNTYCGAGPDCTANPGMSCASGERCDGGGTCALSCQTGLVDCNGTCIDPDSDNTYCGAGTDCSADPGTTCAPGERCNGGGVCELSCQTGLVDCKGTCIDPDTDDNYCGAGPDCTADPGVSCGPGGDCDGAGCVCNVGSVDCNGLCVPAGTCTLHFVFTGSMETLVVPANVTSIEAIVDGAQGGTSNAFSMNFGGRISGTLAVSPGDQLFVFVGEQPAGTAGGFNGGGSGYSAGNGGGGASDLRLNGMTLGDRLIVGGGGGGGDVSFSGAEVVGGQGGGLTGGAGYRGDPSTPGGGGGTQTSSATGTCVTLNNTSVSGGFGFGGTASGCGCDGYGGGGGWYGGAGSGNCRGGGGGSGYAAASLSNVSMMTGGALSGHGSIKLMY